MNIEDLNKTQLLLLTILVNFVTSIATGVLTVSLLDQAPPTVIQTVNRIVDHTIETVTTEVPVAGNAPSSVPSSEDLLTAALAENGARSVDILRAGSDDAAAAGTYLPAMRAVVAYGDLPGTVRVRFSDGSVVEAREASADGELRRYGFAADAALPQVPSARLVPSGEVRQGQTAIARSATGAAVTGIVTRIADGMVEADLPELPLGASVVNLSGDVMGVHAGGGRFVPGERVEALPAAR